MIEQSLIEKLEAALIKNPDGWQITHNARVMELIDIIRQHTAAPNVVERVRNAIREEYVKAGPYGVMSKLFEPMAKAAIAAMGDASTSTKEGVTSPASSSEISLDEEERLRARLFDIVCQHEDVSDGLIMDRIMKEVRPYLRTTEPLYPPGFVKAMQHLADTDDLPPIKPVSSCPHGFRYEGQCKLCPPPYGNAEQPDECREAFGKWFSDNPPSMYPTEIAWAAWQAAWKHKNGSQRAVEFYRPLDEVAAEYAYKMATPGISRTQVDHILLTYASNLEKRDVIAMKRVFGGE